MGLKDYLLQAKILLKSPHMTLFIKQSVKVSSASIPKTMKSQGLSNSVRHMISCSLSYSWREEALKTKTSVVSSHQHIYLKTKNIYSVKSQPCAYCRQHDDHCSLKLKLPQQTPLTCHCPERIEQLNINNINKRLSQSLN